MVKIWDIKHPRQVIKEKIRKEWLEYMRNRVNRIFNSLETRGGITPDGKTAVLFMYNDEVPEKSYILTERL